MLDIKSIEKTFNAGTVNQKKALNGLSLHLDEGDFVTVIGGNGAGKSTMMNAIAGVFPVDKGEITINNVNVTKLPEHKRAQFIGRVFQDPMMGTCANMQIEENLSIASRRGQIPGLRWSARARTVISLRNVCLCSVWALKNVSPTVWGSSVVVSAKRSPF